MDKPIIKDFIKLHSSGDILIVFEDQSGLFCENPQKLDKDTVKKMLSDELTMVVEQHETFLKLDSIIKTFGENQDGDSGEQPTDEPRQIDDDAESKDEQGDGDSGS